MNEDKAARYHRLGRRASLLSAAATLTLLSGLILTAASGDLQGWAERLSATLGADGSPSLVVALYVLALALIVDLILLPVGFYKSFLLERRYGLGTQTVGAWLRDYLKTALIGLLFSEAGAAFVYFALRTWPDTWWIVSGVGYTLVTLGLVRLAPVLLFPLFFKFEPLANAALRDRLTALAARAQTSVVGVYAWTLSDRTRKANAALAGMGKTRRIILSDTLLSEYSDDEIEVILAHELAHHVHRDIRTIVIVDSVLAFGGFFAGHLAMNAAAAPLGLGSISDPAGIPILLIASGALAVLVKPILNSLSRAHERRADAYALHLTRNPTAFMSAMRRLGQQNLAEDNPSRVVRAFFYTHPPIKERLRAAQDWAAAS